MLHLRCAKGSGHGAQFSLTPVLSSRPSCLTSVWHHHRLPCPLFLCCYHHKAWLSFCKGNSNLPPIPCSIPNCLPTWPDCSRHTDRMTATTQHRTTPFKSRAVVVLSDPVLFQGKTAKVHTLAWL